MKRRWAAWAVRVAVAAVFLYAGAVKVPLPGRFALDIESYRLIPPALAAAAAFYLPWLEIVAGAALLLDRLAAGAALVLGGLTVLFLGALLSAWARGLEIRCGCFGAGEVSGADYPWWIGRDLALLAAVAFVWMTLPRNNLHAGKHIH